MAVSRLHLPIWQKFGYTQSSYSECGTQEEHGTFNCTVLFLHLLCWKTVPETLLTSFPKAWMNYRLQRPPALHQPNMPGAAQGVKVVIRERKMENKTHLENRASNGPVQEVRARFQLPYKYSEKQVRSSSYIYELSVDDSRWQNLTTRTGHGCSVEPP